VVALEWLIIGLISNPAWMVQLGGFPLDCIEVKSHSITDCWNCVLPVHYLSSLIDF